MENLKIASQLSKQKLKEILGGNVPSSSQPDGTCTGWTGPDATGKTTYDAMDGDGNPTCGIVDHGEHPAIGDMVVT